MCRNTVLISQASFEEHSLEEHFRSPQVLMREKLKSIMHSRNLETLEKFIDIHSLIQQFPFLKKKKKKDCYKGTLGKAQKWWHWSFCCTMFTIPSITRSSNHHWTSCCTELRNTWDSAEEEEMALPMSWYRAPHDGVLQSAPT